MTAATSYTQIRGLRPGDRTVEAEPLVPFCLEQTNRIATADRHNTDGNHWLDWTRSRYAERYTAPGP